MARFTTTTATSLTVALVSGICLATSSARGAGPEAPRASVDLAGHWIYNVQLSDDAREKMRQGTQGPGGPGGGRPPMGPGGGGGGAGTGGRAGGGGAMGGPPGTAGADDPREAMGAIMEPAEELTITESGAEVEVDEKFGRMRRLHTDGKKYKTDNGAAEIKASWKDGKLLVETKRMSGGVVIETWERAPDGRRLIVSVRLEGGFGPKLELKRIYDRAPAAAERPQK